VVDFYLRRLELLERELRDRDVERVLRFRPELRLESERLELRCERVFVELLFLLDPARRAPVRLRG
jgi:hypothetical protein